MFMNKWLNQKIKFMDLILLIENCLIFKCKNLKKIRKFIILKKRF